MSRSLLFLDLATTTGWAHGVPGERCNHGAIRPAPAGASPGLVGLRFEAWLKDLVTVTRPARIIYEAPFHSPVKNANTTMITWGLAFTVDKIGEEFGIPVMTANLNSIRKTVLGRVPRSKDEDVKGVVIDYVKSLGYEPQDNNAADAILGFLYAGKVLSPRSPIAGLRTELAL